MGHGLQAKQRERIRAIFTKFVEGRAATVRGLKISELNVNPFFVRVLARQMGFESVDSIVRWLVAQRLERGFVTSFGNTLQDAARVFSEGTGVEGADILKRKGSKTYHIQVKSGPNTVPKDLGGAIAKLLKSAQRRNRGSVALYGMCYGSKEQVSGIVKKYVQEEGGVDWITGRDFWKFISGDPNCMYEIYEIAADVGDSFRDKSGQALKDILEAKIASLRTEFIEMYGTSETKMWENLLEHNS